MFSQAEIVLLLPFVALAVLIAIRLTKDEQPLITGARKVLVIGGTSIVMMVMMLLAYLAIRSLT